jgi:hypothetical protein
MSNDRLQSKEVVTILFLAADGTERGNLRLVDYLDSGEFLERITELI